MERSQAGKPRPASLSVRGALVTGRLQAVCLAQPLTLFSFCFINISVLPGAKPGCPHYTLCPKLVNSEVALRDKAWGQKALVSRSVISKTLLHLLGS